MDDTYKKKVELAIIAALNYVRENMTPHDTNNLRYNALKMRTLEDGWEIYVDDANGDTRVKQKGIAPYMKYTNENWSQFQPPLQGKQNPNEKWWQRACEYIIKSVSNTLGGVLTKGGVND